MRECTKCHQQKNSSEFNKNKMGRDGLQSRCRQCASEYHKLRRIRDRDTLNAKTNAHRRAFIERVNALKESVPCTDCGQYWPSYVMEYDHVVGDKRDTVSNLVRLNSKWQYIEEEIAKCELVCANCHRVRTHERGYKGGCTNV